MIRGRGISPLFHSLVDMFIFTASWEQRLCSYVLESTFSPKGSY